MLINLRQRILNTLGSAAILLCIVFTACQEPEEGCLDVEATNYNVAADDPCADCCTYPKLSLSVSHRYGEESFNYDSIYAFAGFAARFEKSIFYLSDFRLRNLTDSLEVTDTIELDIIGGGAGVFKDDYTLVSRSISSFSYELGEIRGTGNFTNLKFLVGIKGDAEIANAEVLAEDKSLALTTDTLWTFPEGYVFNRVIITPDTLNPLVSRQIDVKGPSRLVEVSLAFEQSVALGFNVEIPLKIDYEKWFSGIDFVGDTDNEIIEKIVDNTTNAFSIEE